MSFYRKKGTLHRAAGWTETATLDGQIQRAETGFCVHCGGHFPKVPGSGKVRGYCFNCSGDVCGPGCAECVPLEQLLENLEQGRPLNYRPVVVFVPGSPAG